VTAVFQQATANDIPLLVKARLDFLEELGNEPLEGAELNAAQTQIESFLRSRLGTQIFAWIVFVNEEPASVGFLHLYNVMFHPMAHSGLYGRIINMLTWPDFRRQGLARGIMERLIAQARELGLDYIGLDASPDGRHLYDSLGFVEQHPVHPPMTLDF